MPDTTFRASDAHTARLAELAAQHNASLPPSHHVTYSEVLASYRRAARNAPLGVADLADRALAGAEQFCSSVRLSADPAPLTAAVSADDSLTVRLEPEHAYTSPEHALFAITEFAGHGYEALPAFRAAWLRAVRDYEPPFARAAALAIDPSISRDRDLLPTQEGTAK